jgi:hypothetical protein
MANKQGYVFEHRLIMAKLLNRPITKNEIVHHINGIITDNQPSNLKLFSSNGEHSHLPKQKIRKDKLPIEEKNRRRREASHKYYNEHKELCKKRTYASYKKRMAKLKSGYKGLL